MSKKYDPSRSIRVDDETWEAARRRAKFEDHTISRVVQLLLRGYADGAIRVPRERLVYDKPTSALSSDQGESS